MSNRLFVATRKGLFSFTRSDAGWSLTGRAFLGDPVTIVLSDPRDGAIYAGLSLGHFGPKLHRSDDDGASWVEVAAPAYPPSESPDGPSVHTLWALEHGGLDRRGLLWCGTIPGGLFRSDDRGESWALVESLWNDPRRSQWFGGGADQPGIHSVCVDPRDSDRLLLGVSCGGVWQSADAGGSWEQTAHGMKARYMPPERVDDPNIQDPHRIVRSRSSPDVLWCQHHCGVFRSTDGGRSWQELSVPPSSFGFAVAVHPHEPDTAYFVPALSDEKRIPVEGAVVVTRTRDGGSSFDVLREGLPQRDAYDVVFRHALDIDGSGDRLAFGSTTGGLWISEDGGDRWAALSTHLPPIYALRFAGDRCG